MRSPPLGKMKQPLDEKKKVEGKQKIKKKRPPPPPPGLKDDLTTIAHLALLTYVLLICYLCFAKPFTFFTWHPLLLSIGWALLTSEAVLFISKENLLSRRLTRTWKLRLHYAFLWSAAVLIAIGFIVIITYKNDNNKKHFQTWHGIFGLLAIVSFVPAVFNGVAALYEVELKSFIKPNINKLIHQASGTVSYVFGGLSLILGVYTKWFDYTSSGNKYFFLIGFTSITFVYVWTLQRPFLKCLRKFFKVPI